MEENTYVCGRDCRHAHIYRTSIHIIYITCLFKEDE